MLIYLASPYTHPDHSVEDDRFEAVVAVAGRLIKHGYHIFSPIAMCHPIARMAGLETKFDYWQEFDRKMLAACGQLWICDMPGWMESRGIAAELDIARALKLSAYLLQCDTLYRTPILL